MNTEEKLNKAIKLIEGEIDWHKNAYKLNCQEVHHYRIDYLIVKLEELKKSNESEAEIAINKFTGIAINKCVGCGKIPKINHQTGSEHFYISCHNIEAIGYTIGECIFHWNRSNPLKMRPGNPLELEFVSNKEFDELKKMIGDHFRLIFNKIGL